MTPNDVRDVRVYDEGGNVIEAHENAASSGSCKYSAALLIAAVAGAAVHL